MAQEVGLSCLGLSGGPPCPCSDADLCRYNGWKRTYLECRILVPYLRARYYDSKLGRFVSRDPLGYEGGGLSLYEYVEGSPTGRIDPSGQQWNYSPSCPACNGVKFDPETQCCEDGAVVNKVSMWVCNRRLKRALGVVLPHHMYVCCSGANVNCFGHANNDLKAGEPIPPEGQPNGRCEERKVCPRTKDKHCKNPTSPCDAGTFMWNCRAWAEWQPNDDRDAAYCVGTCGAW